MKDAEGRLTEQSYWEDVHTDTGATPAVSASIPRNKSNWRRRFAVKETIASRVYWELISRYVEKPAGATVVEVGSAPGRNLLEFHRRFGYSPFGIEYTTAGLETNREVFRQHHLDPDAILHADLFDEEKLKDQHERFDIVFSGGLIEHFEDPKRAVQRHVDLLAPSGILVISIPNLQGLNWLLCKLSCPERLAVHNLALMNSKTWAETFNGFGLTPLYSGYGGVVDFGLIDGHPSKLGNGFLKATRIANALVAAGLSRVTSFQFESRFVSPNLVYIGRKES